MMDETSGEEMPIRQRFRPPSGTDSFWGVFLRQGFQGKAASPSAVPSLCDDKTFGPEGRIPTIIRSAEEMLGEKGIKLCLGLVVGTVGGGLAKSLG